MKARLFHMMWYREAWSSLLFLRSGMIEACSINRTVGIFEIRLDRPEFPSTRTQSMARLANYSIMVANLN